MGRWQTENPDVKNILSREAASAIEPDRFVKDVAGGKVQQCVLGEQADGVSRGAGEVGRAVAVQYEGDLQVEAGAAVADRAAVTSDANGRAITAGVGQAINGDVTNGTSAGALGDIVTITKRSKAIANA